MTSWGTAVRAAKRMTAEKGNPRQTFRMITDHMASPGSPSHCHGYSIRCARMSIQLITLYRESNIHFQDSEESAMGMTKGMRISPWTRRLPLKVRLRAKARGKPIRRRMASEPKVNTKELRTVCQNTGSAKRRV